MYAGISRALSRTPLVLPTLWLAACAEPLVELAPLEIEWEATQHPLGRGYLLRENVEISGDRFTIRLDRDAASGGEARTSGRLGGGTFEAVIRCADAPGSLCAFFLYEGIPGDENDEIDIEVFNDGSRRAFFTTWVAGVKTNFKELVLPFDPAGEARVYRIERRPDAVTMLIDGVEFARFTERLPANPLHLYLNAWWPVWLTPEAGADPAPQITVTGVRIDAPVIDHPPSPY